MYVVYNIIFCERPVLNPYFSRASQISQNLFKAQSPF